MGVLSMVFKGVDNLTPVTNSVRTAQNHLNKDTKEASALLKQLGQRQEQLAKDMSKAQAELEGVANSLREAKKEFKDGKLSEAHLTEAIADYNRAKDAVGNYAQAIKDTKKAIRDLGDEQRRQSNRSGSAGVVSGEGKNGLLGTLAKSGLTKMLGGSLAQVSGALVGSALGNEAGTMFSSTLSGVTSGAAMGMVAGPWGAVIGGLVGGISGIINGQTKIFEEKDDAFKAYVQETTEAQLKAISDGISNGSSIAATRETDLRALTSLFGGNAIAANQFQRQLIDVGRTPPFSYETAMSLSRDMLGLGLSRDESLDRINSLANASAALGLSESNVSSIVSLLESSQLAGKLESRVVKSLSKMGLNVYSALADAFKINESEVADKLSTLDVEKAVQAIYDYMGSAFPDAAKSMETSFSGLSGMLESYETDMDNAYGEGYNEERKKGMREQIDFLGGESGASMQEANRAMGAWKASLENEAEEMERTALETVMTGITSDKFSKGNNLELRALADEYADSKKKYLDGDQGAYAQMGYALARAKIIAQNEYNATDGAKLARESELGLAEAIRSDTQSNDAYWNAGYEKGQQYTKGLARGISDDKSIQFSKNVVASSPLGGLVGLVYDWAEGKQQEKGAALNSHAAGLFRVPYDRYKAELHEGERVLTASETRQADRAASPNINITVNVDGSAAGNDKDLAVTVAQEIVKNLAQAKKLYAR